MLAIHAHAILMEQAEEQILRQQPRIRQLGAADACHEGQRPAPAILGRLRLLAVLGRGRRWSISAPICQWPSISDAPSLRAHCSCSDWRK